MIELAFPVSLCYLRDMMSHDIQTLVDDFEVLFELRVVFTQEKDILLVLVDPVLLLISHILRKPLVVFDQLYFFRCFRLAVDFLEYLQS